MLKPSPKGGGLRKPRASPIKHNMSEAPKNKIERKPVSGLDFTRKLKINELLKELGEDPYKSELRFDVAEIISNLNHTLAVGDLRSLTKEEIEIEIDAALTGERESITKMDLSDAKRQQIKNIILKKLQQLIE